MDARAAIKLCIDTASMICDSYLGDLSDADLMKRPHPKCNHLKWQLGHLITSENKIMSGVAGTAMPPLPDGFADKYTSETAVSDESSHFHSKDELLSLAKQQRAGTLAVLEQASDEDLAKESPEFIRSFAPTVAAAISLQGSHWMMHAGQWVIVRRELGHPALF